MSKIKVLFLCTGNSCRSQMAEGLCRHLKSDVIEAYSAGIETHGLNPYAVKVMQERGIDISQQKSKTADDLADINFEFVVTVCDNAQQTCPIFSQDVSQNAGQKDSKNVKVVHQGFEDPPVLAKALTEEEDILNCYRKVRDEIEVYIVTLPESLN